MNTNIFLPILIKIYPNIYSSKVSSFGRGIMCLVYKQDRVQSANKIINTERCKIKLTRNILYNLNINTRYPNIIIMLKRCTQTVTKQLKRKYFYNLKKLIFKKNNCIPEWCQPEFSHCQDSKNVLHQNNNHLLILK